MKRVIILTLLAAIGSCITMFIVLTIADSFGMGLYSVILTFGNILLPTLGAVLLYKFIIGKVTFVNSNLTIIFQVSLMAILLVFGLYVWAAVDTILFKSLTWENIKNDYDSQFSGFLPVVLTEAVLIPTIDLWLTKQKRKKPTHNNI